MSGLTLALLCGGAAVVFGAVSISWILKRDPGSARMQEYRRRDPAGRAGLPEPPIPDHRNGRVVLAILIAAVLPSGLLTAAGFVLGAILSGAAGFIGMNVSVRANVRTAQAATEGLNPALNVAFRGRGHHGDAGGGPGSARRGGLLLVPAVDSLGVGSAHDVASDGGTGVRRLADLDLRPSGRRHLHQGRRCGRRPGRQVEAGIPEDDPRNPAVIADNVGDNVGDCAGMAADLFETFAVTVIATMLIGRLGLPTSDAGVIYPLALSGVSIIGSIVGCFFVKSREGCKIMNALYRGLIVAAVIALVLFWFVTRWILGPVAASANLSVENLYLAAVVGIALTAALVYITEYYTGTDFCTGSVRGQSLHHRPCDQHHCRSGHFDEGLRLASAGDLRGHLRVVPPGRPVRHRGGRHLDAVDDRHHRRAGRLRTDHRQRRRHRRDGGSAQGGSQTSPTPLDAVGNTTKAVTKGYAIGSAGLGRAGAVCRLQPRAGRGGTPSDIRAVESPGDHRPVHRRTDPLPVRRDGDGSSGPFGQRGRGGSAAPVPRDQGDHGPYGKAGLFEGCRHADRGCDQGDDDSFDPAGVGAVLVGWVLGPEALGGVLMGTIVTGLFVAISMTTGGGAWDNAKKYIEEGNHGGKGSDAHKAAVTGDTVGDPYKDTAGPAVNPLIRSSTSSRC